MSTKEKRTCIACGSTFERYRAHLQRPGYGLFCSLACRNKPRTTIVSGADACLRKAFAAGYRATAEGVIVGPHGSRPQLRAHHKTRYLSFSAPGCRSPISVHRFIAFQLFGEPAMSAECVRHLDDNRANNRSENIAYGTRSQNQFDIPDARRSLMGQRRNRGRRRFSDEQVREIRRRLVRGQSINSLRKFYGCSLGVIANIRDGRTYQDVP